MNDKLDIQISLYNLHTIKYKMDIKEEMDEKNNFYSKNQYIEEPWYLIDSYFKNKHLQQLVKHQVESYNEFINIQMPKTIEMFNPVHIISEKDYIEEFDKNRLEVVINFKNMCMYRPEIHENNGATKLMFPNQARLRNFTYASNLNVDICIDYKIRKGDNMEQEETISHVLPKIHLGKIPIMLKSSLCVLNQYKQMDSKTTGECEMDPGGYFIINGQEKTCLGQEKTADNKIFVYKSKKNEKIIASAEVKCVPDWKVISPKQVSMFVSSKIVSFGYEIFVNIPRIKKEIPLFVLFRIMGVITDKDICSKIVLNNDNNQSQKILNFISGCIFKTYDIKSREDAINYVLTYSNNSSYINEQSINKRRKYILDIIDNDLFPHCKTKEEKIYLLGYMTNKLVSVCLNYEKEDDRDSYVNKRIETTGILLNNLFRNYFNKLVRDMSKLIIREINNGSWKSNEDYKNIVNMTNIYKIIKTSTIENGINRALATGDFGIKAMNTTKVGIAQVLNRLTYVSSISHLRRINNPIDKSGKLVEPRKLHGSSWGFLCPAETPEGQSIGIVKNISSLTNITSYSDSSIIEKYIEKHIINISEVEDSTILFDKVKVFINSRWIGITENPIILYNDLKQKKYSGIINIYTSIMFNYSKKELYIYCDPGRLIRPVLKVKNNKLLLTRDIICKIKNNDISWNDLFLDHKISESILEYIDCDQQSFEMISMKPSDLIEKNQFKFTHCEIHPSLIFGVLASCIPYPEHNQSPRNTYQCAMGKQAIGVHVKNFRKRMDKTSYLLNYGMKPLVETRLMNMLQLSNMPSGNQIIVAIMTHSGFNQEDSILVNKSSIERGMFQATIYHTEKDDDGKKINGEEEIRKKPDKSKTKNIKFANYDKINKDGFMNENTLIEDRDIIMAKVVSIKQNKNDNTKLIKYEDHSTIYKTHEKCYVDKNYINRNGDGYKFCKVRIRATRQPVIGDKFSSRHGQKGTVGNIIPEENMPFTKDGLVPDIIINPHAIPSRMTIAQLKETLLGKVLLQLGLFGDGTSFGDLNVKSIIKKLHSMGYESKGNELMHNGMTGEQIETSVFIGPVFYQRLKHMVSDKQHSRDVGPMVNLTRQPPEGRSRDGGLRIGEMERDCIVAHGASRFVKERLYDSSDKYSVHVCKKCGMFASYNEKESISSCNVCDNTSHFAKIDIPYSCKLLFQELIAMNVVPRIITE